MISALVVSHNAATYLPRCLASLRTAARSGVELEVIVVDNASSDDSLLAITRDFPEVFVEALDHNIGFGAANNRAAALARGDRLLLINADAWLGEGALARLDRGLEADPRAGLIAPQLRDPDGGLQTTWAATSGVVGESLQRVRNRLEGYPFNHRLLPSLLRRVTGPGWYSAACCLLRRAAWDAVDGFDERYFLYFEDVDLCRRLVRAGWRMRTEARASVFHVRGASRDPEHHELRYRTSQLAYYERCRPRWECHFLRRRLARKLRQMPPGENRSTLAALLEMDFDTEQPAADAMLRCEHAAAAERVGPAQSDTDQGDTTERDTGSS